jgi:hypothetical protein
LGASRFRPPGVLKNRWQVTNNLTKIAGNHTMKFGADFNLLLYNALFEVNFGGVYGFPPNQLFGGTGVSAFQWSPGLWAGAAGVLRAERRQSEQQLQQSGARRLCPG